jgi:rubrerythrin
MDDLVKTMQADLAEEIADCMKYLQLATKAEEGGMELEPLYFEMMAYDEYTHARFLLGVLDSLGAEVPDDVRGKFWRAYEEVDARKCG